MSITAVWGPPNSGKTTLAIDLAYALTRYGRSVCLLSPEPYGELGARLGLNIPQERSLLGVSKGEASLEQTALRVSDLLLVLGAGANEDAFGEDLGSEGAKRLLDRAEKVVLLSGCRSASGLWFSACARALAAISGKAVPVCLEVSPNMDYPGLLKLENMTPALWVPYYPGAEEAQGEKKTLYGSGGRSGRAYTESIDALCAILLEEGEEA